ncbi:hypothetical protein AS188_11390 [Kocuria flava]|uniref:DUF6504 domain-containing protein n=1 Tax=Kocuria flava TaxID=446860 RepID=A0A0U3HXZ8_9MICC|nr:MULTISPECIES: DUF6504 family protein [Kocuria]ALU40256.1 hypothetical protein AS188_11390 [Kocuria flava]MCD1143704.1 DUF6504 family protein [Kocuria sp. LUK]PLC12642.1 hypothetical protein AUQ48_10965 [Kocuria flava]GEO93495.1 hypothetical protein KFL01_28010 [Kocuria flava]
MGVLTESVDVDCDAEGVPVGVRWRGRAYRVAQDPVRWYERRAWWAEDLRLPRERGAGVVDQQMWRVQVQLGPRTELLTLELVHTLDTGRWRLLAATSATGIRVGRCA